jgi:uncharacterized membrane protein
MILMPMVIIIIIIIILVILLIFMIYKNNENFCGSCQGIGNKVCTDKEMVNKMYVNSDLTENSELIRDKNWPSLYFDKFNK